MSLWEKWEREKLRKKGFRVREPKDVEIHASYMKPNIRKQIAIVSSCSNRTFQYLQVQVGSKYSQWQEVKCSSPCH